MGKIIVAQFVTLDGVFETPEKWSFDYHSPSIEAVKFHEMDDVEALLLGRRTFDIFAGAFGKGGSPANRVARRITTTRKVVVTSTQLQTTWANSEVLATPLADFVAQVRKADRRDVLVVGSGQLVNSLLMGGLVDEVQLLLYPLVRGEGRPLFDEGVTHRLAPLAVASLERGVMHVRYQVQREAA